MMPVSKTSKVGHGPLSASISLQHREGKKWTVFQPETYPQEDTSEVAHFPQLSGPGALPQLLREFLQSCKAEGLLTVQALRGLRTRVPKLFAYLDETGLELLCLKARDAQSYIGWLSSNRCQRSASVYSGHTVAAFFTAAVSFYEYLRRRGLVLTNPFKETRRIRSEKHILRGLLKESEMEELLKESLDSMKSIT